MSHSPEYLRHQAQRMRESGNPERAAELEAAAERAAKPAPAEAPKGRSSAPAETAGE